MLAGVRQFHGRYSVGDDRLWGVVRRRKSATNGMRKDQIREDLPPADA
jgi:hypothetical protein